jgi:hypothetical protein
MPPCKILPRASEFPLIAVHFDLLVDILDVFVAPFLRFPLMAFQKLSET